MLESKVWRPIKGKESQPEKLPNGQMEIALNDKIKSTAVNDNIKYSINT